MSTISLDEAQTRLPEIIEKLRHDEEVIITLNDQPVARLRSFTTPAKRKLGTMRGTVKYISPDFDAPLDDFIDCR